MADLPVLSDEFVKKLQNCTVLEAPTGTADAWGIEVNQLRQGKLLLLQEFLGAGLWGQIPNGSVYFIPNDTTRPCLELRPGGIG